MPDALPEFLIRYLTERDTQRGNAVADVLASLTERELLLVKEAAVMGYVRGKISLSKEKVPRDSAILTEVVDACLASSDLYPVITSVTEQPKPAAEWHVETRMLNGIWSKYGASRDTAEEGRKLFQPHTVGPTAVHAFRLVRADTAYTVEALHDPDADPDGLES